MRLHIPMTHRYDVIRYNVADIPFKDMWLDDELWFPTFLAGNTFLGKFAFQAHDEMVSSDVQKVEQSVLDGILKSDWRRNE